MKPTTTQGTAPFSWYDEARDRRVDLLVEYEISREHDGVRPDWEAMNVTVVTVLKVVSGKLDKLMSFITGRSMSLPMRGDDDEKQVARDFWIDLENDRLSLRDDVEAACWAANSAADAVGRDRRNEARAEARYGRS